MFYIMSYCTSAGHYVFYPIGDGFVLFVVYPIDVYEFDRKVVSRIEGLALRIKDALSRFRVENGSNFIKCGSKIESYPRELFEEFFL